jgi:hypothetical protein
VISRILTYLRSQVLGLVAIFIALGGTGYAAMSIPRHSVGRRQLKRAAVGHAQLGRRSVGNPQLRTHAVSQRTLAAASVGSRQLRKGSVRGNQIAPGSVDAAKLAAGSVGTSALAAGSVGAGQIAAGAVGNAQLAPGSVAPGDLTGFGGFTLAFAIVGPSGTGAGSPGATFSGYNGTGAWSNGNGEVHFATGLGANTCLAFSDNPQGNSDGSTTDTTAGIVPVSPTQTTVRVTTQVVGSSAPTVAVWIECTT